MDTQSARSRFPFYFTKRARYHEIDSQGVVYNAHYLTYFDIALTEFARAGGWKVAVGVTHDFHVVKAEVTYKKPIRLDEDVDICVILDKVGRSSLRFHLEIHGANKNDLRAEGAVIWVWADQETGLSHPLPTELIEAFQN